MARGVKAGTAYIDVKLGSFAGFKSAALAQAQQVGAQMASKMGNTIAKHPGFKQAGANIANTVGNAAANAAPGRFARFKNSISKTIGETGLQSGKNFVTQMGLGFKALGLADGQFAAASFSAAGRSLGTAFTSTLKNVVPKVGSLFGTVASSVGSFATSIGSSLISGLGKLPAAMSKASSTIGAFSQKVGLSSYLVGNLGQQLTFLATVPVVGAATALGVFGIKAGIALENATVGLAPFVGGIKNAQKEVAILSKIAADSPAFNTEDVISYSRKLQAAHLPQEKTIQLMRSLSNIFTTLGVTQEGASTSLLAITQVMQKGKVSSEELTRQLGQQIPAWDLLSEATGKSVKQLQDEAAAGKFTSQDFVNALIKIGNSKKFLDGASSGALTLQSRFENLKENIQNKLANAFVKYLFPQLETLIGKYGPALKNFIDNNAEGFGRKLGDTITKFAGFISKISKAYSDLTPSQQDFVKKLAGILVAAGPVLLILSKIGTSLGALGSAFSILLTPVGAVAALVGVVLAGALYLGKGAIKDFIDKAGGVSGVFKNIQDKVTPIIDWIKKTVIPIFQDLKKNVDDAIRGFTNTPVKVDTSGKKGHAGKDSDVPKVANVDPTPTTNKFAELRKMVDGLADDINNNLQPAIDRLKKSLGLSGDESDKSKGKYEALKQVLAGVALIFGAVMVTQILLVVAVFTVLVGAVTLVIDILVGLYHMGQAVVQFYKDLFTGNFSKLGADLKAIWNSIWETFVSSFVDAGKTIWEAISGFVKGVIDFFKHLWDVLVGHSIIPDTINGIVSWFLGLPGRVIGAIASFVGTIVGKFSELKDKAVQKIKDLAGDAAKEAGKLPGKITGAIGDLGGLLVDKGRQLINGLVKGMADKLQAVKDKAKEIAGAADTAVAHRLQVNSPSKIGIYLGEMFGQGLVVGQGNKLTDIQRSARSIADAAIPRVPSAAAGFSPDNLNSGNVSGDVNVTVNVPAPVTNPAEIATYTARQLSTSLANKTI